MKTSFVLQEDYLIQLIKINESNKPFGFFSLSPYKKFDKYCHPIPNTSQFLNAKDVIKPINEPFSQQFHLKQPFESSIDAISHLLTNEVHSIKLMNCSLNVCLEFIKNFLENPNLVSLKSLKKLKFVGCEINDRFSQYFFANPNFSAILNKIQSISLQACTQLTVLSVRLLVLCKSLGNLSSLNLSQMSIDEEALFVLAPSELVKNLKSLKLMELKSTTFTKGLQELFISDNMPKLQVLAFSEDSQDQDNKSFNKYGFQYLSKNLRKLKFRGEVASFRNNSEENLQKLEVITWSDVKNFHYPKLRSLSLQYCNLKEEFFHVLETAHFLVLLEELDFSHSFFEKKALKSLEKLLMSSRLNSLKALDFSSTNIKDSTLSLIAETSFLGSLQSLRLDNCREITNEGVERILYAEKKTQNLRELTLHHTNISDDIVYRLVQRLERTGCKNIKVFDLRDCPRISSNCLGFLLENANLFVCLEILKLSYTNIHDYALEILAENRTSALELAKLDVSSCAHLTSQGFKAFFAKFKGAKLRHLKLRQTSVDDDCVELLTKSAFAGNLEKLKLNGCKKISEKGVSALFLATDFRKLRVLSLLGVAVTNSNIAELTSGKSLFTCLRRLNLMNCRQITTLLPFFSSAAEKTYVNFDWDFFMSQFPNVIDDKHAELLGKYKHNAIRKASFRGFSHVSAAGFKKFLGFDNGFFNWPLLESIDIGESRVNGDGLKSVFNKKVQKSLRKLLFVRADGNFLIEDEEIMEIFRSFSKNNSDTVNFYVDELFFRDLHMSNKTLESFCFVQNIAIIDLSGQSLLGCTDPHKFHASESFRRLFSPKNLIVANVIRIILDKTNVTDADILHLQEARSLLEISLNECPKITTQALTFLCKNANFSQDFDLRCLLRLSHLINDGFLQALAESPYLKTTKILDFAKNRFITYNGLEALFKAESSVKLVKKLNISQTNLSDKALEIIAKSRLPGLEKLDLVDCPLISAQGLCFLLKSANFSPLFDVNFLLRGSDVKAKLNDSVILAIIGSVYRKNYTKIDFKGLLCRFSTQTFLQLIRNCENIQEIDIRKTDLDANLLETLVESPCRATLRTLRMEESIGLNEFEQITKLISEKIAVFTDEEASVKEKYKKYEDENLPDKYPKGIYERLTNERQEIKKKTINQIKNQLKLSQIKLLDAEYFPLFDKEYYLFSEKASVNDLALQFLGSKLFETLNNYFPLDIAEFDIPHPEKMLQALKYVNFTGNLNITYRGIADLLSSKSISNLEILDLSSTKLDDRAIQAIAACPHLKALKNLFFLDSPYITSKSLQILINSQENLCQLNLEPILRVFSHWVDDLIVESLANSQFLSRIRTLYLNKSRVSKQAFESLQKSQFCTNLKCLEISEAFLVDDAAMEIVAKSTNYGSQLREIIMHKTPLISVKGLLALLGKESALTQKFDMFKLVFKQKLELMTGFLLENFLESRFWMERVKKLSFKDVKLLSAGEWTAFFEKLSKKQQTLTELSLQNTVINDEVLEKLAISPIIRDLHVLDVRSCHFISSEGLRGFFSKKHGEILNKLRILYDPGVVRLSLLQDVAKHGDFLTNLQELDFSKNLYFNNESLKVLISANMQLKGLRSLNLSETTVDNEGIISLCTEASLQNLIVLRIKGLVFGSSCLQTLAKATSFSTFFRIYEIFKDLEERRLVNDEVLEALVNNCQFMQETVRLDLSGCDISSIGVSRLASSDYARNLEVLDISFTEVDDIGVISLAKSKCLPAFQRLIFNNCSRITKISLKYLANTQKNLKFSWLDIIENQYFVQIEPESPSMKASVSLKESKKLSFDYSVFKALCLNKTPGNLERLSFPSDFRFKPGTNYEELLKKGLIFRTLEGISFVNNANLSHETVAALCASPYLRNLRYFYLKNCEIDAKTLKRIVLSYNTLINLEIASVFEDNESLINDEVLEALKESPFLAKLRVFSLKHNKKVTFLGIQSLARSVFAYNLKKLDFSHSNVDDLSLKELAQSSFLLGLQEIILTNCVKVTVNGLKTLFEAKNFSCEFSLDALFSEIAAINSEIRLNNEVLACLNESPRLFFMRSLKLFYKESEITAETLGKFFNNPALVNLQTIILSEPTGLTFITKNLKNLRSLRTLDLKYAKDVPPPLIAELFRAMTPEREKLEGKSEKNYEGYIQYKLLKKDEENYKVVPNKFDIQTFLDTIKLDLTIFKDLIYCPLFYKARHFIYEHVSIHKLLLKDLVFFQQSRNIKEIIIKSNDIDVETASYFAGSKVLFNLKTLQLPNLEMEVLSCFIKTNIVHRDYEPFSLFKNTIKSVRNHELEKIGEWDKLLNTQVLDLHDNQVITSSGVTKLLSSKYCCQITEIDLSGTRVDEYAIQAICQDAKIPRLQKLRVLNCPQLTFKSLILLCDDEKSCLSPFFDYNLPFKDLKSVINDEVLRALTKSRITQYIRELDFAENVSISQDCLMGLFSNKRLNILKNLYLRGTRVINKDFLKFLSSLTHFSSLETLCLFKKPAENAEKTQEKPEQSQEISEISEGIAAVFGAKFSDYFKIKDFIVEIKRFINDSVCIAMRSSILLRNLDRLDLSFADFSSEKLLEILENPYLTHLYELDVSFTRLNSQTLGLLSSCSGFKHVNSLNIEGCKEITETSSLIHFFDGEFLSENFDFQGFFNDILEKFDKNFITFSNVFLIPLIHNVSKKDSMDNSVESSPKSATKLDKLSTFNEEKEKSLEKKLINEEFFRQFLQKRFFMQSLVHVSLSNYRYFEKVATFFFEYPSTSFDISEFLFNLPLKIQRSITDQHLKKIVDNFNYIKYIQLKNLPNVTFGINYLLKADCETKFELAFKAIYLKKPRVQRYISADSLTKFLEDTDNYPEFYSFFREINFANNRYLSSLYENSQRKWQEVNENSLNKFKGDIQRWDPRMRNPKGSIYPNSEAVSPNSPNSEYRSPILETAQDLKVLSIKGQRINLIDDKIQTEVLLPFIKKCQFLKKLNLGKQNLGDLFLKEFSMFLNQLTNLKNLRELNLEDNPRITGVGLKYLYTSVYKRAGKLKILLGKDANEMGSRTLEIFKRNKNTIEQNERNLVENDTKDNNNNVFREAFLKNIESKEENKDLESGAGSPAKEKRNTALHENQTLGKSKRDYFASYQTFLTTLMIYGLFETINMLFDKFFSEHYLTITLIMLICLPFTIFHLYKLALNKLLRKIEEFVTNDKVKNSRVARYLYACLNLIVRSFKCKCLSRKKGDEKPLDFLKDYERNVFYFDQDVAFLNSSLSFKRLGPGEASTYNYRPFFLRFFPYFILVDFVIYYLYVIIYPAANEITCGDNNEPEKNIIFDVPYYLYALLTFICEALFLNEIAKIMNSKYIMVMQSFSTFMILVSTQTARYDLYTDFNFMVLLFRCGNTQDLAIASLLILFVNFFFTAYHFLKTYTTMYYKYKSSMNQEKTHPTFFLDSYTQLAFTMDYQGLGNILDRFSTKSASIIESKFFPSFLRGIYFPSAMISRFQRMLVENLPLIVIQLIFMARNGLNFNDFTQMKTFVTTIISIVSSLNRVWEAKPSLFQRKIFKKYYAELERKHEIQKKDRFMEFKERASIRKARGLENIQDEEEEDEEGNEGEVQDTVENIDEKSHLREQKIVAKYERNKNVRHQTKRITQKSMAVMIENDDDEPTKHKETQSKGNSKLQGFKLNPILSSAKEEIKEEHESLSTIMEKNSVFGNNFHSKDSENEQLVNFGESSPVKRRK